MKTEIKPTYVTFEQAKWLKEKGAKLNTHYSFSLNSSMWYYIHSKTEELKNELFDYNWFNSFDNMLYAPEQWQVVEWLRVNHGIWISVLIPSETTWYFKIESIDTKSLIFITSGYNTPQEAYSAAFDYIQTNNLI